MPDIDPIAVNVVTGFLGAGKTTLVNRLLADPALTNTAVIVNEFGEISIDHLLVETSSDDVIALADGCICCSVRGALVDTLTELIDKMQTGQIGSVERIVIETTGLADPRPVLQSLMAHPALMQALRLETVVCVFDAVTGPKTLEQHPEAVRQVAVADTVVITKADLAIQESGLDGLAAPVVTINPRARIVWSDDAFAAIELLKALDHMPANHHVLDASNNPATHDHHDHQHDHDHAHGSSLCSLLLTYDAPLEMATIGAFLDLLRSQQGAAILRMKGVVWVKGEEHPLAVHGVRDMLHPPIPLSGWPSPTRQTQLVIIGDGLDEAYVRRLFDAFVGRVTPDAPDRAALEDNPLAIPGFST